MKTMSIYQNAGWADKGWVMENGVDYPHLSWEGTSGVPIPSLQPIPLNGSGTAEDPYLISTAEEFALLSWYPEILDKHIRLTADLNLTGITLYPIGDLGRFTGVFDGDGYTISNVIINEPKNYFVGLLGWVGKGGQIHDLGVENVYIEGGNYVGGLVGRNYASTITGCYITGSVSGTDFVGGLVGENNISSMVTSCSVTGSVNGTNSVGGLIGRNYLSSTITCCYANNSVHGEESIGGLVGYNDSATINECYATGRVSGVIDIGGLVGKRSSGSVIASFWDKQTSGRTSSAGGTGKTTAEMMMLGTFVGAGWDFTEEDGDGAEWRMLREGEDYPRLAWQEVYGGDIAGRYGVDMEDLLEVAGNWLEEGCPAGCEEADINGDGRVDLEDWAILARDWLEK